METEIKTLTQDGKRWPRDSAGHHITTRVPVIADTKTIHAAQRLVEKDVRHFDTVDYLYIVDEKNVFKNVLSIKELFRHEPETILKNVPRKDELIVAHPDTDQEKMVYRSLRNNIKAVPVVRHDGTFLGAVPSSAILKILYRETREDLLQLAGVHSAEALVDNVLELSLWQSIKHRFLWLFLGLLGGIFAAKIISGYEETLQDNLVLAAFIPLIVYMGDAVGTQMQTFAVRDFFIERRLNYRKYFMRHLLVVCIMSILFGALLYGFSFFTNHNYKLSAVLSIALVAAIISSVTTGLLIPYFFIRIKFDPANASGPIGTIIQDIISILIYFAIANWLL